MEVPVATKNDSLGLVEKTIGGLHDALYSRLLETKIAHPKTIIDVGCGSGAWLARFSASETLRRVGVDQSVPDGQLPFEFHRVDLDTSPAPSLGKFELVTCIEVIEHVENVGQLLDLLVGSVENRGTICITSPNIESLNARVRALVTGRMPHFDEKSDPTHRLPILSSTLHKMMTIRSFELIDQFDYPSTRGASLSYSRPTRALAALLSVLLPDKRVGDCNVFFFRRAVSVERNA